MATIVTRSGKGSPLTNTEVDANFTNLNADKAELSGAAFTGAITTNSTFDGRDVATDGTKLDGIEASADVTDATNVTAAGALMDSELTSIASVKALDQGVATTDSPTFAGATVTGEIAANGGIALGDNDKATFGASDDLQIYHDGSNSYVTDVGTGNLWLGGANVGIGSPTASEYFINCLNNGAVTLYHNGVEKLATTSTGINVTGNVVADGLTVDGTNGTFSVNSQGFIVGMSRPSQNIIRASAAAGSLILQAGGAINRLAINSNGDISFYDQSGTSQALFWDASAESLGIGTTSPQALVDLSSATTSTLRLSNTDTVLTENQVTGQLEFYQSDASNNATGITGKIGMRSVPQKPAGGNYYGNSADMDFYVSGQLNGYANDNASLKAMTIQAGSGSVGIGVAVPSTALDVAGDITATGDINLTAGASDWAFTVTGNNLIISYGGTAKAKLDTSGNLTVIGNVTAYGSI